MGSPSLSTYGGATFDAAYPGQIMDLANTRIDSFANESSTAIDFGAPAARGAAVSAGMERCRPVAADADEILGVTVKFPLVPAGSDNVTVNYPQWSRVGVARSGSVAVLAAEDVRGGDEVLVLTATPGTFASSKGGVAGTGRVHLSGWIWKQDTSAGKVGIIEKVFYTGRTTT